jgi:hypothetical protein
MKRRRKDSGFAMLMVFLLSACIAITLYVEVPRVAFQAERQRELLLVDRGNQFKRAIQVFVHDRQNNPTGRYPASIDELESFNNHRYLRHRYVDPMTGKDEWRLVHINGGILTDSVTTQAKPGAGTPGSDSTTSTYLSQQAFLTDNGAGGNAGAGGVQRALNRRPSDAEGAPGAPGAPGALGDAGGAGANGSPSGASGLPPGIPGLPGQSVLPGQSGQSGQSGQPGAPQSGGQQQAQQPCNVYIGSCAPTTTASGTQGNQQLGQQPGQSPNGGAGLPPGLPGGPGFGTPGGANGNAQQNAQSTAAQMIGNLLTTPRPGGMPSGMPGSTTIGGGIAGVASKYEAEGIMVINQRTKINEWEYIFDATKWRPPPNPVAGTVGTQQPAMSNGPNGNNNTNAPAGTGMSTGGPGSGSAGPGGVVKQ